MNEDYNLKERRYNSAKDFIKYLKSLPDPDITDPKVSREFGERLRKKVQPEIEKIDRLHKKSWSGLFKVIKSNQQ